MKWITMVVGWLVLAGAAMGAERGPTWGQHGMAMFGGAQGLYASHLPMFHAPHDYQVILKLRLSDPALDAAVRARLDGKTALWTIAPEKFELFQFAPGSKPPFPRFRADLVLGHFEQDGKTQYANATVIVEQVVYFRKLSDQPSVANSASYIQVGSGKQRFLVKEIDSRPDFDHIVAVTTPAGTPRHPLVLPKAALLEPGTAALKKAFPAMQVRGTVYFYTDDLK